MSMSTLDQLHADRTARLARGQQKLRLPTFRSPLFNRKERRVVAARVAATC